MSISHWGIFPGSLTHQPGYNGTKIYWWVPSTFNEWCAREDYWDSQAMELNNWIDSL